MRSQFRRHGWWALNKQGEMLMSRFEYECHSEMICNENAIYPAMKTLVEDEGMNVLKAAVFVESDSDGKVTQGRAYQVYYRRQQHFTRVKSKKPLVERIINSFNTSMNLLDELIGQGPESLSVNDKKMMNTEFRYTIPSVFLMFDKMGVDVEEIVNNIKPQLTVRGDHVEDRKNHGRTEIQD